MSERRAPRTPPLVRPGDNSGPGLHERVPGSPTMSWAKCLTCGKQHHWHAARGTKLVDLRSPCCNAILVGPTAGRPSTTSGKRYETCTLCGRRSLSLIHPPTAWKTRFFDHTMPRRVYEAGLPVHSWHEPVPAEKPDDVWPETVDEWRELRDWARRHLVENGSGIA